ncbi:ISL3 family transposase [Olivibacter sp. SDN3]|uniref:ISL3 family transposase n=1 Tax=Olivibacter sp. SDN3 TaxID=2764720 RepID=UPI001651763B|nr:ISL3 family transposase [Olivibacter sp. SDN3]QNL48139.1 ISL3 family transposase [Olivibacter sp. SDN3]
MNATKIIFNSGDSFRVISVDNQIDKLNIYVQSTQKGSACPNCCLVSSRIHSYYTRKFNDLPSFGKSSRILLRARKFYCLTDECPLKVFTERFDNHFRSYQRKTERLQDRLLNIAIEAGGKSGERICGEFSIPVSDTTLLRIIDRAQLPKSNEVVALGVDDWAIRKRERYGSILVDLAANRPIGLLGDREEKTLSGWLKERHKIQVISRDRYGNYQRGSTKGAPQAIQVTDRWHLLKNLGEAVRKILDREHAAMKRVRDVQSEISHASPRILKSMASPRQQEKFREVKRLLQQDIPIREIARRFKMSRITVRKYKHCEELPRKTYISPTGLEEHLGYIKKRKAENPAIQLRQLHTELKGRGYQGAYSTLSDGLARHSLAMGKKKGIKTVLPSDLSLWRPSRSAMLFFNDPKKLSGDEPNILNQLCTASIVLRKSLFFIRQFRQMMFKDQSSSGLQDWIQSVSDSSIPELCGFAKGLRQDFAAIKNAFDLPWSNGPVEGNVNKLKTLKRQMYGRCSLRLLEKRLILAPS